MRGDAQACRDAWAGLTRREPGSHVRYVSETPVTRRPLKSRSTGWAGFFSRNMLRIGLKPNTVSVISIVGAAAAGGAFLLAAREQPAWLFWLAGAAGVQFRLFCNLMDGLLAVEGGLKSPTGEMFNELPDRIGDALILVPLGYAGGTPWSIALGWAAACGAVGTAYIRAMGAGLTGHHDFCGPMAKPHRMAAVTVLCFIMMALDMTKHPLPALTWGLALIVAGIFITCWRRIAHLAGSLKSNPRP
jgi:phosphatidylglycerophosphate synthase